MVCESEKVCTAGLLISLGGRGKGERERGKEGNRERGKRERGGGAEEESILLF